MDTLSTFVAELAPVAGEAVSPRAKHDFAVKAVATPLIYSEGFPERPKSPPPQRLIDKHKKASPRESSSNTAGDTLSALSRQVKPETPESDPIEVQAPINLSLLSLSNPHLREDLLTFGEGRGSLEVAAMLVEELTRGRVFVEPQSETAPATVVTQNKPRAPTSPAPSPPLSRHTGSQPRPRLASAPTAVQTPTVQEAVSQEAVSQEAESQEAVSQETIMPEVTAPESPRKQGSQWQPAVLNAETSPAASPRQQRRGASFLMGQRSAPASPQPSPPASPATARKREEEVLTDLIFRPKTTCIEAHMRILCGKLKEKKFEDIRKFTKKCRPDQAALFQAVADGDYEKIMKAILNNRELVESCRDSSGRTIMHVAVKYNREGIVDLLVAKGFTIDVVADKGAMCRTPLHESVIAGHYRITCALLATGQCNPDAQDLKGLTPLQYAAMYGHDHLILPLCKAGATKTMNCTEKTCSEYGANALQIAVTYAHVKVFEALLEQVKGKQEKDMLTKKTLTEMLYEVSCRSEINDFFNHNPPLSAKNILDSEKLLKEEYEPIIKVLALFRAVLEEVRKENLGSFDPALYVQRAKNEGNAAAEQLFMLASQVDAANGLVDESLHSGGAPRSPRSTTMDAVASRLRNLKVV